MRIPPKYRCSAAGDLANLRNPRFSQFAALVFAALYLVLSPAGVVGPLLMLCGLVLSYIGASSETFVASSFLIAPYVSESLMEVLHLSSSGKAIAAIVGVLALLNWPLERRRKILRLQDPAVLWLAGVGLVLIRAYFDGLQTPYASDKLIGFIIGATASAIAFSTLVRGRSASLFDFGIIACVSSIFCLSTLLYATPALRPISILKPAGLRMAGDALMRGFEFTGGRRISQLAGWGLASTVGASSLLMRRQRKLPLICGMILGAGVALVALNTAGQRAALVALLLGTFVLAASKAGRSRVTAIIAACAASFLVALAIYGVSSKNVFFTNVFRQRQSLTENLNRSTNWNAALKRIGEKPLWGHGLGGYYIDFLTLPGGIEIPRNALGPYPHNLFLELLVETGIIGTTIIVAPVLSAGLRARVGSNAFSMLGGESLLPLVLYCFVISNATYDLHGSSIMFGICASLWPRRRRAARGDYLAMRRYRSGSSLPGSSGRLVKEIT